jgi:hypothetical protein
MRFDLVRKVGLFETEKERDREKDCTIRYILAVFRHVDRLKIHPFGLKNRTNTHLIGENEVIVWYRYHYSVRYRALPAIPPSRSACHPLLIHVIVDATPLNGSRRVEL